jgi:hypothetical protein
MPSELFEYPDNSQIGCDVPGLLLCRSTSKVHAQVSHWPSWCDEHHARVTYLTVYNSIAWTPSQLDADLTCMTTSRDLALSSFQRQQRPFDVNCIPASTTNKTKLEHDQYGHSSETDCAVVASKRPGKQSRFGSLFGHSQIENTSHC